MKVCSFLFMTKRNKEFRLDIIFKSGNFTKDQSNQTSLFLIFELCYLFLKEANRCLPLL